MWKIDLESEALQEILPSKNKTNFSVVPPAFAAIGSAAIYRDFKWSPDGKWLLVTLSLHESAEYFVVTWGTGELIWQSRNPDNLKNGFYLVPFGFWYSGEVVAVKSEQETSLNLGRTKSLIRISLSANGIEELAQVPRNYTFSFVTATRDTPYALYSYWEPGNPAQIFHIDTGGNTEKVWEGEIRSPEVIHGSLREDHVLINAGGSVG